jgi:uncharacterized protein (DUF983 family)
MMSLNKKPALLPIMLRLKCPQCGKGNLFSTPTFSFRAPFEMEKHCSNCGESFFPEPGFYFGAMFISYIISAWFCIGFVMLLHWVFKWSLATSFALLILVSALFFVYLFRVSRAIWLGLMVKRKPSPSRR